MKSLPPYVVSYKRTPEFTEDSVPKGLLQGHSTKAHVWGKLIVLEGQLIYRILEPTVEEILLSPDVYGVIEPAVKHEIVPSSKVRFYVEFYRESDA